MDKENRPELQHKWLLIFGIVVILIMLVAFILYAFGVITKLTMTLIYIVPIAAVGILYVILKKRGM